jgi:hypothetical protein
MKVGDRYWVDYAGDRDCGTEDRAKQVAQQLGIKNYNSENDAKQVISECKKQNNPPKQSSPSSPSPEAPVDSGPSFVGKNADGQGLTAAEYDLYSQQTMFGLSAAQQTSIQNSINATSLAIQNLANEASNYAQDAETGRNVYSEDAASWRTDISTQRQKEWNMFDSAMDAKAITDSAKIQGEYSLDLGAIMRAGNEAVAGIQGEYSTANTRLRGEYDLASQKVSSAAARDVAQRNKEASMFGSFLGGFWA